MRHYLGIQDFSADETREIMLRASVMKANRGTSDAVTPLCGEAWALLFNKASTRTRLSFEVGLRELGAQVLFLSADSIQMGRGESVEDTARVMGRMVHGAVIRTYAQSDVDQFATSSGIITINALTDVEHPCQVLTDLFTIEELRGPIADQHVVFIGDGACNVPISWVLASKLLNFRLTIAAPQGYQPPASLIAGSRVEVTDSVEDAVRGADVLYTDVWVSMGKEDEKQKRLDAMRNYQINEEILGLADPDAIVMHCLPAYRGLEISEEVFEAHADTIFTQAENRLHVQKAIVAFLREQSPLPKR
jgi:ornithine carbamoyltransferase